METTNFSTGVSSVREPQGFTFNWQSVEDRWAEGCQRLDAEVRKSPRPYLFGALALGYILQVIPWRALFVLIGVICLRLIRPLLFLVGAIKLTEYLRKHANDRI
jgi:hypothetical protein